MLSECEVVSVKLVKAPNNLLVTIPMGCFCCDSLCDLLLVSV